MACSSFCGGDIAIGCGASKRHRQKPPAYREIMHLKQKFLCCMRRFYGLHASEFTWQCRICLPEPGEKSVGLSPDQRLGGATSPQSCSARFSVQTLVAQYLRSVCRD